MDGSQLIMILAGACGAGGLFTTLITGAFKHLSGAAGREQQRNANAIANAEKAWERMDELEEDKRRIESERDSVAREARLIAEYASTLRRRMTEAGIDPGAWPSQCPDSKTNN